MKIQDLAIIFVIIILPISIVLSAYTQFQIKTINMQTLYDTKLTSATYDAIKAFQINTANSSTSDVANSKLRDLEASVSTFKNSIITAFGLNGYTEEQINEYIPALVYTMYDGFYIYSPYTNTNHLGINNDGENIYGLKPYITYSMRYKKDGGNTDVVITYSLDNYIVIQGKVNGNYVNDEGYLVDGVTDIEEEGDNVKKVTYNGIEINPETDLKEWLPKNGGNYYNYVKINGTKYYQINGKFYYILNGTLVEQKLTDEQKNEYTRLINNNNLGAVYYARAHDFTERVKNYRLSELKYSDAYDETVDEDGNIQLQQLWPNDNRSIFDFNYGTNEKDNIENKSSDFNQHRLAVIRHKIETNLSIAIANFNNYSGVTGNDFQMPELREDEWDYVMNNISLISFLQGMPIGGKEYNGYTIVTNSESKEVVLEGYIYILGEDGFYHKIGDTYLETSSNIKSGVPAGRLNLDFKRKSLTNNDGTREVYYYPLRDYNASYDSIVTQNKVTTYDDIYEYINTQKNKGNTKLATAFYTALGRERQGLINSDVISGLDKMDRTGYLVRFNANPGNTTVTEKYINEGEKYGELPIPTRPHYTFKGWYTEPNGGGTKITSDSKYDGLTDVLYARWDLNEWAVNFDAQGGTVSPTSQRVVYSMPYNINGALPIPTRDGYGFVGWYTLASDGAGDKITGSESYMIDNSSTLFAHWTALQYKVEFDSNGGSSSITSKDVIYDSKYGDLPIPSRPGYTFTGWYTEGGTQITSDSTFNIIGGTKLYAHWTPNTYIVTFNANGGNVSPSSKNVTFDSEYGTLPTPTRTGYRFIGWYTDASGGTQITNSSKYTTVGNSTIYAHWAANTYTINYNLNGGTHGSSHPTTVNIDSTFTVSNPTQSGWTFTGWEITGMDTTTHTYGGSTTTGTSISSTKATSFKNLRISAGTVTFTAHWSKTETKNAESSGNSRNVINVIDVGSSSIVIFKTEWSYYFEHASGGSGTLSMYLQGSNDRNNWTTIRAYGSNVTGANSGTDNSRITGYRYYRVWKDGYMVDSTNWEYEGVSTKLYWKTTITK